MAMRGKAGAATAAPPAASSQASGSDFLLFILLGAITMGGLWLYCTFQQLITTHDAAVGLLQGGVLIPKNVTPEQLLAILQSHMDKHNKIAWTIAFITQALVISAILPNPFRGNLLYKGLVLAAFLLEITTDMWYSVATETTLGGAFTWVFNFGGGGWLVSLSYIILMMGGSVFFGYLCSYQLKLILSALLRGRRS